MYKLRTPPLQGMAEGKASNVDVSDSTGRCIWNSPEQRVSSRLSMVSRMDQAMRGEGESKRGRQGVNKADQEEARESGSREEDERESERESERITKTPGT